MIYKALNFIVDEFKYFLQQQNISTYTLILDNISLRDENAGNEDNQELVLTLISVEEEKTLKNTAPYIKIGSTFEYQKPPIFLNLYILIAANTKKYDESLKALSKLLEFFQLKRDFDRANHPVLATANIDRLQCEILNLELEQTHNLWTALGGKLLPSVFFKIRLVAIQATSPVEIGIIEEILINEPN